MVRVDESVGNNNILSAAGSEDNEFRNIVRSKRLNTTKRNVSVKILGALLRSKRLIRVDGIGLGFVTVEADNREFLGKS